MLKLESVLENETLKHLGDFGIQTDHLISARRLEQFIELFEIELFNTFTVWKEINDV